MTRIHRLLGQVAILLAAAALAQADTTYNVVTTTGSGITVRLTTPLTMLPRFGFMPVRVFVENNSERDGTWAFISRPACRTTFPARSAAACS